MFSAPTPSRSTAISAAARPRGAEEFGRGLDDAPMLFGWHYIRGTLGIQLTRTGEAGRRAAEQRGAAISPATGRSAAHDSMGGSGSTSSGGTQPVCSRASSTGTVFRSDSVRTPRAPSSAHHRGFHLQHYLPPVSGPVVDRRRHPHRVVAAARQAGRTWVHEEAGKTPVGAGRQPIGMAPKPRPAEVDIASLGFRRLLLCGGRMKHCIRAMPGFPLSCVAGPCGCC
jgi:hypothetical protein